MERSTRRREFFKRLKTLIHSEVYGEKIRYLYQKVQGIKGQPTYSRISLFKMIFF
ncbi:MAG: hypothetical protein ACMUEL_02590 [Flavobacteriales bacterium Tduv]